MLDSSNSWAAQQIVELLAAVSACEAPAAARRTALERAAEAVEADVAALVEHGQVTAATGFPADAVPEAALLTAAATRTGVLALGREECPTLSIPLADDAGRRLVLGRVADPLDTQEAVLLRGMARVLHLTLVTLERRDLLERLTRIQRSILRRERLEDVFDAIVDGARSLLDEPVVGLRLIDAEDPASLVLVASAGIAPELRERLGRTPVTEGVGGAAVLQDELVAFEGYAAEPRAMPAFDGWLTAALAAPVRENGQPIGSLTVGSARPQRHFTAAEREILVAFAEHASLALTDARNYEAAVRRSLYDPLTGLANRRLLLDRLAQSLARARRAEGEVSVLYLDVDDFKGINDSLGHAAGDELLRQLAQRVAGCIRAEDTAARLSGDELAVLTEQGRDGAERTAERVLRVLEPAFEIDGRRISVHASVGIAGGATEPDELLRHADLAMYAAKSEGKGRAVVYAPEMQAAALERRALAADLRRAIERAELVLHYQPIVELDTGELVGAEALVRWEHPARGLLGPDRFIPLAEETGLIVPIGAWVLREACRQAVAWSDRWPELRMGVNVSGHELALPGFIDGLAATLRGTGLDPSRLVLELTETVLMCDVEATIGRLWEAKRLGVEIAVDDFGTGHSSLQYLLRFPLGVLKVPRTFVEHIDGTGQDRLIGGAIIDLAASLGLRIVAEGIEREGQRAALLELECAWGQGFHFARPGPAEAFAAPTVAASA